MTDLVELAERRERASELLQRRFSEGIIDVDLYEERVAVVESATTLEEVQATVADLRPDEQTALVAVDGVQVLSASQVQEVGQLRSILGNARRTGAWTVPRRLEIRDVLGSIKLDLRQAHLPRDGVTLDVDVILGDLEVLVPPGMPVSMEVNAVLAEVADPDDIDVDHRLPPLRVVGRAVLANVEVKSRLPGETGMGAFFRRRRERRLARAQRRQRALPPAK